MRPVRIASVLLLLCSGLTQLPAADWPQWGGGPTRNPVSPEKGLPLDIRFEDGAEHRFAGFHTIQEERLAKLDAAALGKLHARGYLQAAFMIVASLSHFRDLIARASKLDAASR